MALAHLAANPAQRYGHGRTMKAKSKRKAHLLGLGLDNQDGHVRITKGENFTILSGSDATHERMQEICIKANEKLQRRGRKLEELSRSEITDLLHGAG